MAIATPPRLKASTSTTLPLVPPDPDGARRNAPDLLAGFQWNGVYMLVAAGLLLVVAVFAGSSYLLSYYGYFRLPIESLGLSPLDIVDAGVRSVLLPLTTVPAALIASDPSRKLGVGVLTTAGYIVFLAYVAFANHFAAPSVILAQCAASVAIAGLVFAVRRGFGVQPAQRLVLGALVLLLLTSVPVVSGTLDAVQTASAKQSTLRIVTNVPILPGSTVAGGQFTNSNYILLRETDSRYWLLRLDNHYTYSIAKSDVLYVRY
jgi:hypothetical protein